MRISDWSSDACSSDLLDLHHQITDAAAGERGHAASPETYLIAMLHARPDLDFARLPVDAGHLDRPAKRGGGERYRRAGQQCGAVPLDERMLFQVDEDVEDRKSVVEGKSVSVRVDLGGGRPIKKTSR